MIAGARCTLASPAVARGRPSPCPKPRAVLTAPLAGHRLRSRGSGLRNPASRLPAAIVVDDRWSSSTRAGCRFPSLVATSSMDPPAAASSPPAAAAAVAPSGAAIPSWAAPLACPRGDRCAGGECERLHLSPQDAAAAWRDPAGRPKTVICAGPERSGSTWLFNAVRLLLSGTGERTHAYWVHTLTDAKLRERGLGRGGGAGAHLVVKTHEWSGAWDTRSADAIFLTDRDVCSVVDSYMRVGWLPHSMPYLKSFMKSYAVDHARWKAVSTAIVPFDDLVDTGGRELAWLERFAALLGIEADYLRISEQIRALPVPAGGGPDPVTKLWPKHIGSNGGGRRAQALSPVECQELREHYQVALAAAPTAEINPDS
eukprot:SM000048S16527  [mRNA]  locus=s48:186713:188377:+ [translate_table: standard]